MSHARHEFKGGITDKDSLLPMIQLLENDESYRHGVLKVIRVEREKDSWKYNYTLCMNKLNE